MVSASMEIGSGGVSVALKVKATGALSNVPSLAMTVRPKSPSTLALMVRVDPSSWA